MMAANLRTVLPVEGGTTGYLAQSSGFEAFEREFDAPAMAIAAFLQSVKPVSNKVPGPFKPGEKVSSFMFRILPPGRHRSRCAEIGWNRHSNIDANNPGQPLR
jgi:hypothetical protein